MTGQIAVRIPIEELAALDEAVLGGRFESRAEAVRRGLRLLLRTEREREIAEEYRRAYGEEPRQPELDDLGLAALASYYASLPSGDEDAGL